MTKKIGLFLFSILLLSGFLRAADMTREIEDSANDDIFITTSKENLTILPAPQGADRSVILWQKKLCDVTINKPAKKVIEIKITPRKQNAFVQKALRIPRTICSIKLLTGKNRNIYAFSETGNIKLTNVKANTAKLYTTQGITEVKNYTGSLSAETLTSRITLDKIEGEDLKLKTASGNIYASGLNFKNTDILNTSGKSRLQGVMEGLIFYSSEGSLFAKWDALPNNKLLNISARSFAGNIKIVMPRGANITDCKHNIDLKSIYGNAELENN